jgi:hypothetical protein
MAGAALRIREDASEAPGTGSEPSAGGGRVSWPSEGARALARVKQAYAASVLGVDDSYVSLLARGKRQPSLSLVFAMEDAFGIPASAWRPDSESRSGAGQSPARDGKL